MTMGIFSTIFQIFQGQNGNENESEPRYGFQSGNDHWTKNKCTGSGQPLGFIDAGIGFCSVCRKKKLKATTAGTAWPHKAKKVRQA